MSANARLFAVGTPLIAIIHGLVTQSPAIAVTADGPFTVYRPSEVDCDQKFTQLDLVESRAGRQPASTFCSTLAQEVPFALNELRNDVIQVEREQYRESPWSAPYQVGDVLCRDRGSGLEVVCVSPDAAERLHWLTIQTP